MKKISVSWRNALRKVWSVPSNTHCDIMPLLGSQSPIDIQLKCRFLKFYRSVINSDNALIKYLSNVMTFTNRSTMSSNFNRILYDLNIDVCELAKLSLKSVKDMYHNKWLNSVDNQYLIHSNVINELIKMKEGIFYRELDSFQCDLIINFLCTL